MLRITFFFTLILATCASAALAQTGAPQAANSSTAQQLTYTSEMGFSFTYPSDWEVMNMQTTLPEIRKKIEDESTSKEEKQGAECVQISMLIRHGSPASVIEAIVLPSDCVGTQYKDSDIANIGQGMAQGINSSINAQNPVFGSYKIGTHHIWILREQGTFKSRPEVNMTVEVLCGVLKKGVVCWAGFITNDDALKIFENSIVTLDGESPARIVSPDAFTNSSTAQPK